MTTIRFRCVASALPASVISRLRAITNLSIAEIRERAAANEALLEITAFQGDWQERRRLLAAVARDIAAGALPLSMSLAHRNGEESIAPQTLENLIQQFREIELETQTDTMLELGEIDDPSQFTPDDEDWTRT